MGARMAPESEVVMEIFAIVGIVLAIIGLPVHAVNPDGLAEFTRIQRYIGRDVVVVDGGGIVREGRIVGATDTTLELGFGPQKQLLAAADIARVDRPSDSPIDGLVKGGLVGALLGAISGNARWAATSAAMYGGLGFVLDARHTARTTIYRAPDPKAIEAKVTIRW